MNCAVFPANVVAGFSPRFHNVAVATPRAKARDYIDGFAPLPKNRNV
jgi:hypothetical protein